jgi:transposase
VLLPRRQKNIHQVLKLSREDNLSLENAANQLELAHLSLSWVADHNLDLLKEIRDARVDSGDDNESVRQ